MTSESRYKLIAVDLDGTLLCERGQVSVRNTDALQTARDAGVLVTLCTGRGLVECKKIAQQAKQEEPIIVAGGAMIACPQTNETIRRYPMHEHLARDVVDALVAHGHPVMVLKDSHAAGYDYLIVSPNAEKSLDPVTLWWFDLVGIEPRFVKSLDEDDHPEHTVRVGVVGTRRETVNARAEIEDAFRDRVMFNFFGAVTPGMNSDDPEDSIVILEVFDRSVDKWTAILELASGHNIRPEQIATIGNDVNDVIMVREAGVGIAVSNAIPEVLEVAHRVTSANHEHGVADAVEKLLSGAW